MFALFGTPFGRAGWPGSWPLVLAGGVARKLAPGSGGRGGQEAGPWFWRAGWQDGQVAPRSGGRGGGIGWTPARWRISGDRWIVILAIRSKQRPTKAGVQIRLLEILL